MSVLCFGTYAQALRKVVIEEFTENIALSQLLLDLITANTTVLTRNKEQFSVDYQYASKLINCKAVVHGYLRSAAENKTVISKACEYFEDIVIPRIVSDRLPGFVAEITELVKAETNLDKLLQLAADGDTAEFLSRAFLYAMKQENRLNKSVAKTNRSNKDDEIRASLDELIAIAAKLPRPTQLSVPKEPATDEMIYVQELLAAYQDAEGIDMSRNLLLQYPKYKENFERSRKDYYAAESVNRSSRDCFAGAERNHFEEFLDETYDSVIDVCERDYENGYKRLQEVMIHASGIQATKSFLSLIPDWIGASEKKGACHSLVNARRLKWVSDE
jgi:hypothetical protein